MRDPPLALGVETFTERGVWAVFFNGVPQGKLDSIKPAFLKLMRDVSTSSLDLKRMRGIFQGLRTYPISTLESDPKTLYITVGLDFRNGVDQSF